MSHRKTDWRNVGIGAGLQMFEVTTLGQPFDNLKTMMAAHRNDNLRAAIRRLYAKGGMPAFWRGLVPWAWIEASTKGGVVLFTASEVSSYAERYFGASTEAAALLGGVAGGYAQAYTVMGPMTFFKTRVLLRSGNQSGSLAIARNVLLTEGVRGMYKGVNAVALRQASNWGSRFGFSRVIEKLFRGEDKNKKLSKWERLFASAVGGGLACWNQPFEVLRVEMQAPRSGLNSAKRLTLLEAGRRVYNQNGIRGFYRGVTPRVALSVYLTSVMVFGGDEVKLLLANK